jgi:hypothetical protein
MDWRKRKTHSQFVCYIVKIQTMAVQNAVNFSFFHPELLLKVSKIITRNCKDVTTWENHFVSFPYTFVDILN